MKRWFATFTRSCLFFPLGLIISLQHDAENYAESKDADQCCLTATALDVNRPAVRTAALLVLTCKDVILSCWYLLIPNLFIIFQKLAYMKGMELKRNCPTPPSFYTYNNAGKYVGVYIFAFGPILMPVISYLYSLCDNRTGVLMSAVAVYLAFGLYYTVHSSAMCFILTRCFLRFDMLPWSALFLALQILHKCCPVSLIQRWCQHCFSQFAKKNKFQSQPYWQGLWLRLAHALRVRQPKPTWTVRQSFL